MAIKSLQSFLDLAEDNLLHQILNALAPQPIAAHSSAPVAGFGWLLLVMGMALCRQEHPALMAIYVTAFFLVLIFAEIPWAGGIAQWIKSS